MLLSRVAENLYWMSRFVERAENLARLLNVGFYLELDSADWASGDEGPGPVESVLTVLGCAKVLTQTPRRLEREEVLRFLTFDRDNPHSMLSLIARARENARGTQETVSAEAWSHINRLYLYLSGPRAERRFLASQFRFFDGVKRSCILFNGLIDSTLPHGEVYHFMQLGRYLERVDQISRIVNVKSPLLREAEHAGGVALRLVHWTSLLRSCSAHEAYLRTYRERIDPACVVRLLLLDSEFPRSIRFGVARCRESLAAVSGGDGDRSGAEAERQLLRLHSDLRCLDAAEVLDRGLSPFLVEVQDYCHRVGDESTPRISPPDPIRSDSI